MVDGALVGKGGNVKDSIDWVEGVPPYIENAEFEVEMENGTFRKCKRRPNLDHSIFFYTDCTHLAQNAICYSHKIKRWRRFI